MNEYLKIWIVKENVKEKEVKSKFSYTLLLHSSFYNLFFH